MARLRATASAARSVLDGREYDGRLDRVGASRRTHRTWGKKSAHEQLKKLLMTTAG